MPDQPDSPADLDHGPQPLARLMEERGLKANDLVRASGEQLTHRMVARAVKGRRLTTNTMNKVLRAWNAAAGQECTHADLFNYDPRG